MDHTHALHFEDEIRRAVEIGNPWALDDILEDVCGQHGDLKAAVMEIVAEEYRKRLTMISRDELSKLYQECYVAQDDANKDWLLGEIVEEMILRN
jgi:hypothetical protein